jgi:hypothetical protein
VVKGAFHLTHCPVINTAAIVERSYTGEVKVEPVIVQSFVLRGCGLKLIFKKHFDTTERKQKESITTSRLVAEFEATKLLPKEQFVGAVDEMQEFLTFTSFASRCRCVCLRWDSVDERGSITQHFLQNTSRPSEQPGPDETLIDIRDFLDFAEAGFPVYRSFSDRSYLNNAMFALAGERSIVNDRYVIYFTALESLLLHVKHSWSTSKKNHTFKDLFDHFQLHYEVNISDLWPLLDRSGGRSLRDIRNRIAHGQPLDTREEYFLVFAVENLKWLVERMLLAILKWPIQKSRVRKESLTYYTTYDWSKAITQFR